MAPQCDHFDDPTACQFCVGPYRVAHENGANRSVDIHDLDKAKELARVMAIGSRQKYKVLNVNGHQLHLAYPPASP